MAKKNSKIKGKIGELEASRVLGEILGITLRRSQQVKGTADSADIEPTDFDWKLHPEIKRSESVIGLKTYAAINQAVDDCEDSIPFVMSRRNRHDWLIVIRASDLIEFAEEVLRIKNSTK